MATDDGRNPYLFHEPLENATAQFIRIANTAHDAGQLDLETGQKVADIFHRSRDIILGVLRRAEALDSEKSLCAIAIHNMVLLSLLIGSREPKEMRRKLNQIYRAAAANARKKKMENSLPNSTIQQLVFHCATAVMESSENTQNWTYNRMGERIVDSVNELLETKRIETKAAPISLKADSIARRLKKMNFRMPRYSSGKSRMIS